MVNFRLLRLTGQDDDPVGIQVPIDFSKIVLWLANNGDLKATAFWLTPKKLVSNIDFEEIDIDQNTEFKSYQVSIKQLSKDTSIDFSNIEPFDTFEGEETETKDLSEESLKRMFKGTTKGNHLTLLILEKILLTPN